ncbi:MAG: M81 family metallopeptidase [Propionibacteriaceae bacterium]|jgi:microcystin degradation protein MlrC|nr:M81 family metallopeptidase [Propionibacteriaceae bacterium]
MRTPIDSTVQTSPLTTQQTRVDKHLPRVGICGMSIEASTYSPHRSGAETFTLRRDDDLLGYYDFLAKGQPLRTAADWVPLVHARSLPGGSVDPAFYDSVKAETVQRLREVMANPDTALDGLFFDIHGAMNVLGRFDAEADLAEAIRQVVGPDVLISASMDLHGNVSRRLAQACDMLTCYRMAPHEDYVLTKRRGVLKLLSRLGTPANPGPGRVHKAWLPVPILLPGEKTSTRIEPAKSIYADIDWVEVQPGVLDASIWVGYAWGDEPRNMAVVEVEGDDEATCARQAKRLGERLWAARRDFVFVAPTGTLEQCVDAAVKPEAKRPFFISDSGDNPTAGGAGDVTWTLERLLGDSRLTGPDAPTTVVASVFDALGVAACREAGLGATVALEVGAQVDAVHAGPAHVHGVVEHLTAGDETSGPVAVVKVGASPDRGGLRVIITTRRKPYHTLADFQAAGLDPRQADIVVVKIGYLEPELFEMAADWLLALTPGGVDQDLIRLNPQSITRPMYPWDEDMADPDLTPVLL